MTPDVHALTGAYVVNAVSDNERLDFEQHLRECEQCTQEVYELRETTTRLGSAAALIPPPRLKGAVMAQIRQVRQDPPQATPLRRRRPPWRNRLTVAAAAVLLVVASTLGVLLIQSQQETEDAEARAEAVSSILEAGDAQVLNQPTPDGGSLTMLASRSVNRALLLTENLPDLNPDQDYQAWTIAEEVESAGLLPDDDTPFEMTDIATAGAIGITIEPAGGSAEPTLPTIVTFELS